MPGAAPPPLSTRELAAPGLVRALTTPEFARLADVPPEAQWFANLDSVQTKRAFMAFTGINRPEEFRAVTRGHVLA